MKTINSYQDVLNEGIGEISSVTSLIDCALDFLKVQDELPEYKADSNGLITVSVNVDGYNYTINCKLENAIIRITSMYRTGGDEDLEFDYSSEEFENSLNTRDIYTKLINKITRILKRDN